MKKYLFIFFLTTLFACEEGTPIANQVPDTKIFLDEINLEGNNRLNSVVRLHWLGEDQDGYVTGYELSLDSQNWFFTTRTDSTFRFDISVGSDTADIEFFVRAIDNSGNTDPEPAYLRVPIKNTPPTALLDTENVVPDTVYAAWSIFYFVDDLDGFETLDSTYIKINEGPWYSLDKNIEFLTFTPVASDQDGLQNGYIYSGLDARKQNRQIEGLIVGGDNQIFLRNQDISGAFSEVDSSKTFYLRKRNSDLLVIDAHGASASDAIYFPILDQVYPGYDYLNLKEELPPFWAPTFEYLLKEYDKVFWYSDGAELNEIGEQMLMEISANQIQAYLNDGGKLFMTARFSNAFNDPNQKGQSLVFAFTPMDSLSSSGGQARIPSGNFAMPVGAFAQRYDTLVANSFLTGVDVFYPKDPANAMYEADLVSTGGWTGPRTLVARSLYTNGKTNQVFVGAELHKLNRNLPALQNFFSQVLLVEFDW